LGEVQLGAPRRSAMKSRAFQSRRNSPIGVDYVVSIPGTWSSTPTRALGKCIQHCFGGEQSDATCLNGRDPARIGLNTKPCVRDPKLGR
jgi:hypothetical protein